MGFQTTGTASNYFVVDSKKVTVIPDELTYEQAAMIEPLAVAVLNDYELDLNTSMMYRNEDYIDAIKLVKEGKVELDKLISNQFSFKEYKDAYEYIDNNRETTMKVMINVQE